MGTPVPCVHRRTCSECWWSKPLCSGAWNEACESSVNKECREKVGDVWLGRKLIFASYIILCVVFLIHPLQSYEYSLPYLLFRNLQVSSRHVDITRFPRLVGGWFFNSWVNSCLSRPSDTAGLHTEKSLKRKNTPDIRAVVIWQLVVSLQNWLKIQRRPEEQSAMESPCAKQQFCFANDISLRQKLNHDCPFKMLQDSDHEFQSNAMQPHMKGR